MRDRECSGFQIVDPRQHPDWNDLVRVHNGATVFHSREWAEVLCDTYDYRPSFLVRFRGAVLASVLPLIEVDSWVTGRRGISLPFSDECVPLGFQAGELQGAFDAALELGQTRKWKYLELRGGFPVTTSLPAATSFHTHSVLLDGTEQDIFNRCDSSVRRAVRKADRCGLKITISTDKSAVESFFALHCQTRKRHGAPPQPWRFFLAIQKRILETGNGFVVSAADGARTVAAAVFFMFGRNAIYKFGASDERFQESRGNNAVMWEGIRRAKAAGCSELNLGRTGFSNEGLRRFKLGWGSLENRLEYIRFDVSKNCGLVAGDQSEGKLSRIFRLLPVNVNRAIGSVLYPHVA